MVFARQKREKIKCLNPKNVTFFFGADSIYRFTNQNNNNNKTNQKQWQHRV